MLSNILGIAGLIILAIVILWGLIHLLNLSGGWFSGLFSKTPDSIVVHTPGNVVSGEAFTVSWQYEPKENGNYAFLYQCKDDLSFSLPGGTEAAKIPCGNAYTLGGATSSAQLTPLLDASSSVSSLLTVLFIPSAAGETTPPQGSATVVVAPRSAVTPIQTKPEPVTPAPSNPVVKGPADLAITVLSAESDAYGNATVRFDIANIGSGASGVYYFSAQLPTQGGYTYNSTAQAPLSPGEHVVNTLNFTLAVPGSFVVTITGGNDVNGGNNFTTQFINAPIQYNYQYQSQPVYYGSQPQPYYTY